MAEGQSPPPVPAPAPAVIDLEEIADDELGEGVPIPEDLELIEEDLEEDKNPDKPQEKDKSKSKTPEKEGKDEKDEKPAEVIGVRDGDDQQDKEKRERRRGEGHAAFAAARGEANTEEDEEEDVDEAELLPGGELPQMALEFKSQFYFLFGDFEGIPQEDIIFRHSAKMFNETLSNFIRALKATFEINNDVTLEFPQLALSFPQDLVHGKVVKLESIFKFHKALQQLQEVRTEDRTPLKAVMFEHPNNFVKQYNKLWSLSRVGGRAENPIVLSDEEEETLEGDHGDDELKGQSPSQLHPAAESTAKGKEPSEADGRQKRRIQDLEEDDEEENEANKRPKPA